MRARVPSRGGKPAIKLRVGTCYGAVALAAKTFCITGCHIDKDGKMKYCLTVAKLERETNPSTVGLAKKITPSRKIQ